ncbi:hypothetical protein N9359_03395 [Luminiphilus sp.]|nr:hypothetical protein [Luminiphilus sp.]
MFTLLWPLVRSRGWYLPKEGHALRFLILGFKVLDGKEREAEKLAGETVAVVLAGRLHLVAVLAACHHLKLTLEVRQS